jgi:RNA polymerase sigma factor (sigma-70 family)
MIVRLTRSPYEMIAMVPLSPIGTIAPRLEEAVLRRVQNREPAAMEIFFEHFYDRVYGYVASLLRDRTLAEDIAHEAFLRLHKSLEKIDPSRDPAPWVFTVVSNIVRDHWRSKTHRVSKDSSELSEIEELVSSGDGQLEELARDESAKAVRQALGELEADDREVILLRTYQEMDTPQISEILGIKPDAVRQRHSRAVKRLGEIYKRIMDDEPRVKA